MADKAEGANRTITEDHERQRSEPTIIVNENRRIAAMKSHAMREVEGLRRDFKIQRRRRSGC